MTTAQSDEMATLQRDVAQILKASAAWLGTLCEVIRQEARMHKSFVPLADAFSTEGLRHAAALRGIADALAPLEDTRYTLSEPFLNQAMEIYHDRAQSGIEYPDQHGAGPDRHD